MNDEAKNDEAKNDEAMNDQSKNVERQYFIKQAGIHGFALLSSLILWGAADSWAQLSGLVLAQAIAIIAAVVFGIAISHVFHEWSHFFGAFITNAKYSIKAQPALLFFDFDYNNNNPRQFLAMSCGGTIGNVVLIVLLMLAIPVDTASRAMLLSTCIGMLVFVAVLEWPVIRRARGGEETMAILADHFGKGTVFAKAVKAAVIAALLSMLCFV